MKSIDKKFWIQKFENLSYSDFINVLYYINNHDGKLSSDNSKITLKVDGSSIRFGIDEKSVFVESSNSGKIYNPGQFTDYILKKYNKNSKTMNAFDDVLEIISFNAFDEIYNKYGPFRVIGELLHLMNAEFVDDTHAKWVNTIYDVNKLGRRFTIVMLMVFDDNGNIHEKEKEIMLAFNKFSDIFLKFEILDEVYPSINFSDIINNFFIGVHDFEIKNDILFIDALKSRKKIDKNKKESAQIFVDEYKLKIKERFISNIKTEKFGTDYEGFVIELNDIIFKMVSDNWIKPTDISWR